MWKHKRNRKSVPKNVKQNYAASGKRASPDLSEVQKNIYRQAGLALLTVVLTLVILFAMTSAWYTNIVDTKGLLFEAESWGFEGEIIVNRDAIAASPGDRGLVHLEVKNGSDQISAVSINISKDRMPEEMRARMFFYVDTPMVRNEETMERVYINELESYTYTLFNSGKLMLTEKIHNGPQLKWQWVYDVLGYYVLAERHDVKTADGSQKELLAIKEYLRPIEYDYDKATFTVKTDEDGKQIYVLSTVDGETTPLDFLIELSKKDGYPGEIKNALSNGAYPVSVDENGYGIYAYLCDYAEIRKATDYDTKLGQLAFSEKHGASLTDEQLAMLNYNADLLISAQKNNAVTTVVNYLPELQKEISTGTADVIQLNANMTIPADGNTLQIPEERKILLDLNGHSIFSKLEDTAIEALPGSSLTIINGTMEGPGEEAKQNYGITAVGAELVMSEVKMKGFYTGVNVNDSLYKNDKDTNAYIVKANIQSELYAVLVSGNGMLSGQNTQLVVEDSVLSGDVYGLSGNGDSTGNGRWGTDIQLINCEVKGDSTKASAGIYHPQKDSNLLVYNSKVSGYTGIAIKGGKVIIEDSEITGKGKTHYPPKLETNGFTDTADAAYIETTYEYEILLAIRGNSVFQSNNARSLRVFEENSPYVAVNIYSGTFQEEQPDMYIAPGSVKSGNSVHVAPDSTE